MREMWNASYKIWMRNSQSVMKVMRKKDGFGRDEILGTVAVLIIASFVTFPFLQEFATEVITSMGDWWDNTIASTIFPLQE